MKHTRTRSQGETRECTERKGRRGEDGELIRDPLGQRSVHTSSRTSQPRLQRHLSETLVSLSLIFPNCRTSRAGSRHLFRDAVLARARTIVGQLLPHLEGVFEPESSVPFILFPAGFSQKSTLRILSLFRSPRPARAGSSWAGYCGHFQAQEKVKAVDRTQIGPRNLHSQSPPRQTHSPTNPNSPSRRHAHHKATPSFGFGAGSR